MPFGSKSFDSSSAPIPFDPPGLVWWVDHGTKLKSTGQGENEKHYKKAYTACKDCNSRSGSGRVRLPFFDELDAILGDRQSVNPVPVFVIEPKP